MNIITSLDKAQVVDVLSVLPQLRHEISVIDRLTMLRLMRPQWDQLVAAADHAPLYLTYTYCELIAANLFIKGRKIVIVQIFAEDDELVALWPLTIERRGVWRVATHLTCGDHEEYGGPLIRGNVDLPAVITVALAGAMKVAADVLELPYVVEGSCLADGLNGKPQPRVIPDRIGRWGASSIDLRQFSKIDDYYQTVLSSGLRRNLKRQMKALQTHGRVEVGWCQSPDEMQLVLNWLFVNKRQWAKARGIVTPWLEANVVRDFHLELARKLDMTQTPLVAYIKLDGVPIAASLSWVGKRTHEWCITTYDETYQRHGVGVLLLEFLVVWSHAHQLDFDFRFFEADYKDRWANRHESQKTRYVFLNRFGAWSEIQMYITFGVISLNYRRRRVVHSLKTKLRARFAADKPSGSS